MLYNTFGKRTNYKPNTPWGLDELTSSRKLERGTEGGILFARNADGDEKTEARKLILDLFQPDVWPSHLHMITMPGMHWKFERKLLGMREGNWMDKSCPSVTHFATVENNRSIFSASLHKMPGLYRSTMKETSPKPFAEIGFRTNFASHFFCNADDFIAYDNWNNGSWNAAWFDYTGPLSIERLSLIKRFCHRQFRLGTLIVTALKARWNMATSDAINDAGGYSEWLRKHLVGDVLHDIKYMDTSPMAQFAVKIR